jgi:hypothetical protein
MLSISFISLEFSEVVFRYVYRSIENAAAKTTIPADSKILIILPFNIYYSFYPAGGVLFILKIMYF